MKLKNFYTLSIIGIILASFGGGWLGLAHATQERSLELNLVGIIAAFVGMAIIIKTLSTIKNITIAVEDE